MSSTSSQPTTSLTDVSRDSRGRRTSPTCYRDDDEDDDEATRSDWDDPNEDASETPTVRGDDRPLEVVPHGQKLLGLRRCQNRNVLDESEVELHLIANGFVEDIPHGSITARILLLRMLFMIKGYRIQLLMWGFRRISICIWLKMV
ncbi:hypothetical protein LIER_07331 [Lithospermum erythrorhizon]|uniref:Uncharacterized protein n=1 Tax=Lithospermum erythrorhizon TaxID=34254 RepID=A0AAV3P862_LITER